MDLYNTLASELLEILCTNSRLGYQRALGDFSHGELSILSYLKDQRSGICSTELGDALGMTTPRVSAAISSLGKKGLVARAADPDDKRKLRILTTPEGLQYITDKESELREHIEHILSCLGEDNAKEYIRLSKLIQDACHARD